MKRIVKIILIFIIISILQYVMAIFPYVNANVSSEEEKLEEGIDIYGIEELNKLLEDFE